jgi:hypothetical protein
VRAFYYLYFGVGLGGSMVKDGVPLRGFYGNAGEIGHVPMVPNGQPCSCGNTGCLERYVSLEAYQRRAPVIGHAAWIAEAAPLLRNAIVKGRPKDSHDVLGVFHQALNSGTRDSVPPPGAAFVSGLQERHRAMLDRRPEANPGELKTEANFAGTTQFVLPGFVRGTLEEGSRLALTVPEGLARAIFYAFLVSETHPFADGNGRLSRLTMNAELSRLGLSRIIVPTLFHPQYVDCQRGLTRNNEPDGFIKALGFAARWCSEFDYSDLPGLIAALHATNAFEESPTQYKLLAAHGKHQP